MQKNFQKHEYQQQIVKQYTWVQEYIFLQFLAHCMSSATIWPPQLLENIKNQISIFETKEHGGPQKITQNIIYMTKVYYSSLFEPYFVFFVVFVAFQQVAFLNCPRLIQSIFYQSTYLFRKNRFMHSESPSSGVVMSFYAKKTTHFDKLDIFGFF